jgi:hypothetical protein
MIIQSHKGSCLCGAIAYEVVGVPVRFYHCHCQRCRKATGTGHASNLLVKADKVNWLRGEEKLKKHKVVDAERYYTLFCSECGSGMPREIPELGGVMISAGSLDHEPDIKPGARIFWDSRAQWSCSGDGLAVFAEYPQ